MIPEFESRTGNLPPGEHEATWEEFVERFGWNARRRQLLDGIAESLDLLKAAGCGKVWINGSFVTTKEQPGDFDAVWDPVDVDFDLLDPMSGPSAWPKVDSRKRIGLEASGFPTLSKETRKRSLRASFRMTETTWPRELLSYGSKTGVRNDYQ
jgi:hypothetical protein